MTKDEVAQIVHGMPEGMHIDDYLVELVNRAAAVEREACARLFDEVPDDDFYCGSQYAAAIRARGEK